MSRSLVPALAISAVLGVAVAVGVVELFDLGGGKTSTTTVVQQAPLTGAQEKSDGSRSRCNASNAAWTWSTT